MGALVESGHLGRASGGDRASLRSALVVLVAWLCAWPGTGCTPRPVPSEATAKRPQAANVTDSGRVYALLVNGGGRRSTNYRSHVVHLRQVVDLLTRSGVSSDRITILASDGDDPAADLAVRELLPEGDGWLLDGTPLEARIGRPIEYVSTKVDGRILRPATKQALRAWFDNEGRRLGRGDVLLLYVTDHGTKGGDGAADNAITLWGGDQSLTVAELDQLLSGLDPSVRVVSLMSQCFSGGFAWLTTGTTEGGLPTGRVCGFFSTTDDRQAYGCYPENRGDDDVGHSVRFVEALAENGRFADAHAHALVNDHTPDVPLRTSDEYLGWLLDGAAERQGMDFNALVDQLLAQAWRKPARFEPEIRLLDRIGRSFGFASPRSLAELGARFDQIPKVSGPLATHSRTWQAALNDVARANLDRFLATHPAWAERVKPARLEGLDGEEARAIGSELVAELGPSTRRDGDTDERLETLRARAERAGDLNYRMEVREAALLRMESLLVRIAGKVYLETRASADERAAFHGLEECEGLVLGVPGAGAPLDLADRDAFPAWAEDIELAESVLPAWMGIQFRQAAESVRQSRSLAAGAVSVQHVYPGSPAETAGIGAGDVILGPPNAHFSEPRQIREWTMLATIDEARTLDVLHDGVVVQRTLVPKAHPGRFPELPAPPGVGDPAPPLRLSAYRSAPPTSLADGSSRLLFFWATWCAPCKAALPELAAFARERRIPVLAISDEEASQLDGFFARFAGEFPAAVALDQNRATFLAYGVSGTPTFVLVDGAGVVRSASTGYSAKKGLGIEGWQWSGRPSRVAVGG